MADYIQTTSLVPSVKSTGLFKTRSPFNNIIDESKQYSVEGIRTIKQLNIDNFDIYLNVFKPVNVERDDVQAILDSCEEIGGVMVILMGVDNIPVYIPSTFIDSIPMIDGVPYEVCVLLATLGSIPVELKEGIETTMEHVKEYISSRLGIKDCEVKLGGIGNRTYLSKEQHELAEIARINNITQTDSDVVIIESLREEMLAKDVYIKELEKLITT